MSLWSSQKISPAIICQSSTGMCLSPFRASPTFDGFAYFRNWEKKEACQLQTIAPYHAGIKAPLISFLWNWNIDLAWSRRRVIQLVRLPDTCRFNKCIGHATVQGHPLHLRPTSTIDVWGGESRRRGWERLYHVEYWGIFALWYLK